MSYTAYTCPEGLILNQQGISLFLDKNYHLLVNRGAEYLPLINTDSPEKYTKSNMSVLLLRPSTYYASATSSTLGLLAQILHTKDSDCFIDFSFLPQRKDLNLFIKNKIPICFGCNSHRPIQDFDILGVSFGIAYDKLNFPLILKYSGIPIFKNLRIDNLNIPIIIGGGLSTLSAEELHGEFEGNQGLLDCLILGDAEGALETFYEVVKKGKQEGWTKRRIIQECHGNVEGFYEPDRKHSVKINKTKTLNSILIENPIYNVGTNNISNIEISKGCKADCNFCKESWCNKPYREVPLEVLKENTIQALKNQGNTRINLWGFTWSYYSQLENLLQWSLSNFKDNDFVSNRVDILANDIVLIKKLFASGDKNITMGVEGVSDRIRTFLNKNITEATILQACSNIFDNQCRSLKMFFIFTSTETEEDIQELNSLLIKIKQLKEAKGVSCNIRISFTQLLNTIGTPLQFAQSSRYYRKDSHLLDSVVKTCKELNIGFRVSVHLNEHLILQLLELGDRNLTKVFLDFILENDIFIYHHLIARYAELFKTYLDKYNIDLDFYFQEKTLKYEFPFDHIDMGINKSVLYTKYLQAKFTGNNKENKSITPISDFKIIPVSNKAQSLLRLQLQILDPKYRAISNVSLERLVIRALCLGLNISPLDITGVLANSRNFGYLGKTVNMVGGSFILDIGFKLTIIQLNEIINDLNLQKVLSYLKPFLLQSYNYSIIGNIEFLKNLCQYGLFEITSDKFNKDLLDKSIKQFKEKDVLKVRLKVMQARNFFANDYFTKKSSDFAFITYKQMEDSRFKLTFLSKLIGDFYQILVDNFFIGINRESVLMQDSINCLEYYYKLDTGNELSIFDTEECVKCGKDIYRTAVNNGKDLQNGLCVECRYV